MMSPLRRAGADAIAAVAAYGAAWALRFLDSAAPFSEAAMSALPYYLGAQLVCLFFMQALSPASPSTEGRRFAIGVVAGALLGAAVLSLVATRATVPLGVIGAQAWLTLVAGIAWRSVAHLRRLGLVGPALEAAPRGMADVSAPVSIVTSIASLVRYRPLVQGLVARDLKLKYRGSVLGFLWSLLNPLVMVVVYTVAFTYLMKIREPGFVFHLLLGLLAWTFFASSAMMATGAVVDSGGLIKSVHFPRSILPLATVFFNLSQYLLTMVVFLPVMLVFYKVTPSLSILAFVPFLAMQVAFTMGVALTLSALTATYRDVRHLTEVGLAVLFWLTPIVYAAETLPEKARLPILLNPVASFVVAYQQMFDAQVWPALHLWVMAAVYAGTALAVGSAVFLSHEGQFGEQV
jgi:ABC-type polysaccharide/polyol phosphate export permease